MDKNFSRAIAQRFRALRAVRGADYSRVSLYESELKGALGILVDLRLISVDEWDRLYRLASKLAIIAIGCGWDSVRKYNAARAAYANWSSATSSVKVFQDEPQQVSAPAAPGRLSVRGVLVPKPAFAVERKPLLRINFLSDEDGDIVLDRTAFPRLGKHWSPASVLLGYQERKGHAVCRA